MPVLLQPLFEQFPVLEGQSPAHPPQATSVRSSCPGSGSSASTTLGVSRTPARTNVVASPIKPEDSRSSQRFPLRTMQLPPIKSPSSILNHPSSARNIRRSLGITCDREDHVDDHPVGSTIIGEYRNRLLRRFALSGVDADAQRECTACRYRRGEILRDDTGARRVCSEQPDRRAGKVPNVDDMSERLD